MFCKTSTLLTIESSVMIQSKQTIIHFTIYHGLDHLGGAWATQLRNSFFVKWEIVRRFRVNNGKHSKKDFINLTTSSQSLHLKYLHDFQGCSCTTYFFHYSIPHHHGQGVIFIIRIQPEGHGTASQHWFLVEPTTSSPKGCQPRWGMRSHC